MKKKSMPKKMPKNMDEIEMAPKKMMMKEKDMMMKRKEMMMKRPKI